jgi:hypothetical protein
MAEYRVVALPSYMYPILLRSLVIYKRRHAKVQHCWRIFFALSLSIPLYRLITTHMLSRDNLKERHQGL